MPDFFHCLHWRHLVWRGSILTKIKAQLWLNNLWLPTHLIKTFCSEEIVWRRNLVKQCLDFWTLEIKNMCYITMLNCLCSIITLSTLIMFLLCIIYTKFILYKLNTKTLDIFLFIVLCYSCFKLVLLENLTICNLFG